MRSDSDTDWEWLECWNIWICNYVVFAIQIVFFSLSHSLWLPATFWRPGHMNVCFWTLTLSCLHNSGSRKVKFNALVRHFEAGEVTDLLQVLDDKLKQT